LPEDEFKKLYNVKKFSKDTALVFSCRSGKRSTSASEIAEKLGFKNVKNFTGSAIEYFGARGIHVP
jgi:rhodanese-related sulfurtransferase